MEKTINSSTCVFLKKSEYRMGVKEEVTIGVKRGVTIGVKRGVKRYSRLAVSQSRVFLKKSEFPLPELVEGKRKL